MSKDDIIIKILIIILYCGLFFMYYDHIAKGETIGCTVICEIPEEPQEPTMYIIPKIRGDKYVYLESNNTIYRQLHK